MTSKSSDDLDYITSYLARHMNAALSTRKQPLQLDYQLIYDTGTVYGKRYYTVKPQWEPDRTGWYNPPWNDMMAWCIETFGPCESAIWGEPTTPEPMERWYANNAKFWFRDQRDRDWFTLRWAS